MSRIWTIGFEKGVLANEVEASFGTVSLVTSPVRSGNYAFRANPTNNKGSFQYTFSETGIKQTFYRIFVRIATAIDSLTGLMQVQGYFGDPVSEIRLASDNTLELWDDNDETKLGSSSSALSINTWNMVELSLDTTTIASTVLTARLNGTQFATGTRDISDAEDPGVFIAGIVNAGHTGDIYIDDIAINSSSGFYQNSWCGTTTVGREKYRNETRWQKLANKNNYSSKYRSDQNVYAFGSNRRSQIRGRIGETTQWDQMYNDYINSA